MFRGLIIRGKKINKNKNERDLIYIIFKKLIMNVIRKRCE